LNVSVDTNANRGLFEKKDQAMPFPRDEVRVNPTEKKEGVNKMTPIRKLKLKLNPP
jgi:hypothetical protein